MNSHLLTHEELSLLLSPKQENEPDDAAAPAKEPGNAGELGMRVQRLEAALAEMMRRIAFLEAQLSVRQSAAVLAVSGISALPNEAASAIESVAIVPVERPPKPEPPAATLSRVATYKREKRSFFGLKR